MLFPPPQTFALFATTILLFTSVSWASVATYSILPKKKGATGIIFDVPYTFGTHEGRALVVRGSISVDLSDNTILNGGFSVPIDQMTTDQKLRDCHMREAIGLDYALSSYPEGGHVCGSNSRLPESGNDAVKYPNVEFTLTALKAPSGDTLAPVLVPGKTSDMLALGTWTIHGISQSAMVAVKVTLSSDGSGKIRLKGRHTLSLSAHKIEVLSFLGVSVEDRVDVILDLDLGPAVN
jgi:hypothetical protein